MSYNNSTFFFLSVLYMQDEKVQRRHSSVIS